MNNNYLSSSQQVLRLIASIAISHFTYFLLITLFVNNARGLEALAFYPLILIFCIGMLIFTIKKLTDFGIKSIILGIVMVVAVLFLVEVIFHPSIYSGDGSTLVSANLFVPSMMWDNNFEFLFTYPVTYIISVAFNYSIIVGSVLLSKKLLNRR